jgi:hypothetical protein
MTAFGDSDNGSGKISWVTSQEIYDQWVGKQKAVYVGRGNVDLVKSHEVLGERVNRTEAEEGLEDKSRAEVYKTMEFSRTMIPCWPDVAPASERSSRLW